MLRRLQDAYSTRTARLVTGTQRCDHITPVLQQLHWLPVRQRVEFKLPVLLYNAFNNLAPRTVSGRRSDNFKCTVTCISSRLGNRAFAAAEPFTSLEQSSYTCPLT